MQEVKGSAPTFVYDKKRDCVWVNGIPGFYNTEAYHTGDETGDFWEMDLCSEDGLDGHITIGYTLNMDVFESRLYLEVDRLWNVAFLLAAYRLNTTPKAAP